MTSPHPYKIIFVLPSLARGGAERQLCELILAIDRQQFQVTLIVVYDVDSDDAGTYWPLLEDLPHLTVYRLGRRRGAMGMFGAFWALRRLTLAIRPHFIHGYMHANLPALIMAWLVGAKSIWGIRRANADLSKVGRRARILFRLMAPLSGFVDLIIFNSEAGRRNHGAAGFSLSRSLVVPNGFDPETFFPDSRLGQAQREVWGIDGSQPLVGIVGRLNPVKDHATFLRAFALAAETEPSLRAVCIGFGSADATRFLKSIAMTSGVAERVIWAGGSSDMNSAYNALNILVLSSTDEGFPNVLGEAMACGVPCITTNVGDAANIVGSTGSVVDVGDAPAISRSIVEFLSESSSARLRRSALARARIVENFSSLKLAATTQAALVSLLK